jgi:hypothetical protein
VPADKFGREPVRATVENRYRHTDFAPVRGELPVKPARVSLSGGAPKGVQPPRQILTRPVVSIRAPREREQAQPWKDEAPRVRTQARPETRYVIPPVRRSEETRTMSRPPFGAEAGPERDPLPPSPRYGEVKRSVPPPVTVRSQAEARERETVRSQTATREPVTERREARPVARPAPPATVTPPTGRSPASGDAPPQRATRSEAAPQRGENRQDGKERSLPGQPASQTYKGRDRERRDAR